MPEDEKRPGTILLITGVLLFAVAGVGAFATNSHLKTGHYTMTEIPENEVEEYASMHNELAFETLSERSQSIIENTVETEGTYSTTPGSSEFVYDTDAGQKNVVEYQNTHYLLQAEGEGGIFEGLVLVVSMLFAGIGGVLLLIGLVWSPLPRRVVRGL